jgi:hypothetical protein
VRTAKRAAGRDTLGFGVPNVTDPHHLVVHIPRGGKDDVSISEHFGVRAGPAGMPDVVDRAVLSRSRWVAVAETLRRAFNERLKEKGLTPSRWSVGNNPVERLLGKELCVLVWAIERAPEELIPVALTNWSGLRPEERWWLFTMAAAATGGPDDGDVGWRKALRYALTENPTSAEILASGRPSVPRRNRQADDASLSLFGRLADGEGR